MKAYADISNALVTLNRLFDLMLLYVAGCALYRIVRMRHKKNGAPEARTQSSEMFAGALIEQLRPAARLARFPVAAMVSVGDDQRRDAGRFGEHHLFVHG